ncbi:Uma2 family endonuclease [Sphingomonas sp.]|jgi:Uma2 family endonuclease|uniref:Uma2 family endonuclease n=1 Tax=Sphingomonas sp. TaxID=28214 RepID=UPI0035C7A898
MTQLLPVDTKRHRAKLSADDFELLDRHGAFRAYRKTELIDGEVYFVNSQHRPHGMVKMRLYDALRDALRDLNLRYTPVCEFTLALSPVDRPEPDVLLTSEPDGDGFVPLASVPLVIEVSDTTLADDIGRKLGRYAEAGIPEYWVADVNARVIHQFWAPEGESYAERREIAFGKPVTSAAVSELKIDTNLL